MLFTLPEAINTASNAPGIRPKLTFNGNLKVINIAVYKADTSNRYVSTIYLACYILLYVTVTVFMISVLNTCLLSLQPLLIQSPKEYDVQEPRRTRWLDVPWPLSLGSYLITCASVQQCQSWKHGTFCTDRITASSGIPTSVPKIALMSSSLCCLVFVPGELKCVTANSLILEWTCQGSF